MADSRGSHPAGSGELSARFKGRTVIVTGAAQGIGAAVAERLAREGAELLLVDLSRDTLRAAVDWFRDRGWPTWGAEADVSDAEAVRHAVDMAARQWNRVDVLVNCAGVDEDAPFLLATEASWDRVLATNLKGVFLMSQQVARIMVRGGGGAIVHVASVDALGADGPLVSYNVSKAGLLGLNRTMAVELAPHRIRVNAVSPGYTDTHMLRKGWSEELLALLRSDFARVPLRRLVRPEEVAAACAFLASDDASAITGTNLIVDGGLTANLFVLETLPSGQR